MIQYPSRSSRWRGFSILELLVAMIITVIILGFMMVMFSGFLSAWITTSGREETYAEARAALYVMDRELDDALPTIGPTICLTTSTSPQGVPGQALGFCCRVNQVDQPTNANQADVCGVVYFLGPATSAANASAANAPTALFRRLITSQDAYTRLTTSNVFFSDQTSTTSTSTEAIAQNVVSMQVTLRDASYNLIPPGTPLYSQATSTAAANTAGPIPAWVEVTITALSSRAAQTYFQGNLNSVQNEQLLNQQSRKFTLRHAL